MTIKVTLADLWKTGMENASKMAWYDGDLDAIHSMAKYIFPIFTEDHVDVCALNGLFLDGYGAMLVPWYKWQPLMQHKGFKQIEVLDETTNRVIIVPHRSLA